MAPSPNFALSSRKLNQSDIRYEIAMTDHYITDMKDAATPSLNELWTSFLKTSFVRGVDHPAVLGGSLTAFTPADYILGSDDETVSTWIGQKLLSAVGKSLVPADYLEGFIEELEEYLDGLKLVHQYYDAMVQTHLVKPGYFKDLIRKHNTVLHDTLQPGYVGRRLVESLTPHDFPASGSSVALSAITAGMMQL